MNVNVIRVLDGSHDLLELVAEILAALLRHHEIVFHGNGQALPDRVSGVALLRLGEGPGSGFVRNPAGEALLERPSVPLDLGIDIFDVQVWKQFGRKGRTGGVSDQSINLIGQPRICALESIWKVPPGMPLVPLEIELDVSRSGSKDIFIILDRGVHARIGHGRVCTTPIPSRIAVNDVSRLISDCIGAVPIAHAFGHVELFSIFNDAQGMYVYECSNTVDGWVVCMALCVCTQFE